MFILRYLHKLCSTRAHYVVLGVSLLISGCILDLGNCDVRIRIGTDGLENQRQLWISSQPNNYTLIYYRTCFCPNHRFRVTVTNGEIVEVFEIDQFNETVRAYPTDEFENFLTIDDFFALVTDLNASVDSLKVYYDASFGFPSQIDVDPSSANCNSEVLDDEYSYHIELTL